MSDSLPIDPPELDDVGEGLDLLCPSCGADLVADDGFVAMRVCSTCGRHFSIPAQERVGLLVDEGTWRPIDSSSPFTDLHNDQWSALDRVAGQRERSVIDDAIVTGTGRVHGVRAVIVAMDDALVGQQIGALGSEKIIVALEKALAHRLPLVAIVAGSRTPSTQTGPLAIVQSARIASVATQVQVAGIPMVGILTHPTSAPVFFGFASQCDVLYTEPGAHLGVTWNAVGAPQPAEQPLTDQALTDSGVVDGVIPRSLHKPLLARLLALLTDQPTPAVPLPGLSDPSDGLLEDVVELRADRAGSDEPHLAIAIGRLNDRPVAFAMQRHDIEPTPDLSPALRKAQRVARLAGRFGMPLVLIADASSRSRATVVSPVDALAAAKLSSTLAMLPVPVISLGIGRIQGILANVLMSGDRRLVSHHASYHLASSQAGGRLPRTTGGEQSWSARECERLGLVDEIVEDASISGRRRAVADAVEYLRRMGARGLVDHRQHRHRVLGQETEESLAAIRLELREWQDIQQSLGRTVDELRGKLEQRLAAQSQRIPRVWTDRTLPRPDLNFQRPDMSEIATRLRARQAILRKELLERTGRSDRFPSDEGHTS